MYVFFFLHCLFVVLSSKIESCRFFVLIIHYCFDSDLVGIMIEFHKVI